MEISPSLLEFKGDFTKPNTEYLTLSNPTDGSIAFKVKTTAPKLYCVRPNASIVQPGESVKVSIILQSFSQPLPKDYKCKDKFLIVSVPCPADSDPSRVAEYWPVLEQNNKSSLVSKKLRVNYIIETSTAEDSAESTEPAPEKPFASGAQLNETSPTIAKIKKVVEPEEIEDEKELDESIHQINKLSQKLDQSENEPVSEKPSTNRSTLTKIEEPFGGVSLPTTVVLMLLAFLIGWLIF